MAAPTSKPNVVLCLFDDGGFADFGCFGSSIETPNIDRLAENGLRFTNFHTAGLCCASRTALLLGRNQHSVGMGTIPTCSSEQPGYTGRIPDNAAGLARVLRDGGYSTFAVGKWHGTPDGSVSVSGPFDRWAVSPLFGFERFYGLMGSYTSNRYPTVWEDHAPVEPEHHDGYDLPTDCTEHAISYIRQARGQDGGKPFFLYFAPNLPHMPLEPPPRLREKYRGRYDHGWDTERDRVLARQKEVGVVPANTRPAPVSDDVPAWDSLGADAKKMRARLRELYAAWMNYGDEQVGRLVDGVAEMGELDNTIFLVTTDNAASADGDLSGSAVEQREVNLMPVTDEINLNWYDEVGDPGTIPVAPAPWNTVGNTPFRSWKRSCHEGGLHSPLVVSWGNGISARGETRSAFTHVVDVMPTLLDLTGMEMPTVVDEREQKPVEGISFAHTLGDSDAVTGKQVQYFECTANRAVWAAGWKAVADYEPFGWQDLDSIPPRPEDAPWALYHLDEDWSESRDLAAEMPERLWELRDLWEQEAKKHHVLPLQYRPAARFVANVLAMQRGHSTDLGGGRRRFSYEGPVQRVHQWAAPMVGNRNHSVSVEVEVPPPPDTDGVLVAAGGLISGWALYVLGGHLHYQVNPATGFRQDSTHLISPEAVPTGFPITVELRFTSTGDMTGECELTVDRVVVAQLRSMTIFPIVHRVTDTFDIGRDTGEAVGDYPPPFVFRGEISRVVVEVDPPHPASRIRRELAAAGVDLPHEDFPGVPGDLLETLD
jgi:arylsulfatase